MNAAATDRRIEFAPPPQPGMLRAYALAVLAHLLLLAALTWGVHWKRDAENVAVEAELWSSVPQQAAPRAVEPPPQPVPPPPAPAPIPQPAPAPAPPPPPPVQVAPSVRDADIAIARQKKELEKEKLAQQQKLEQEKREQKKELDAEKRAQEKQAALDRKKQDQQEAQRKAAEKAQAKAEAQAEAKAEAKAQAQAKAQAEAKAQAQAQAKAEAKAEAKAQALAKAQADKLHKETVRHMLAMANAAGGANATGNALRSSGPSGSYGARVAAAVRPNVVFPDADLVSGNPAAEFNVQLAPDGTIVGTPKLVKSSGLPAWDDAALRALQKTEKLPRDTDGRVPPALIVDLKPKR